MKDHERENKVLLLCCVLMALDGDGEGNCSTVGFLCEYTNLFSFRMLKEKYMKLMMSVWLFLMSWSLIPSTMNA